MARIHLGDNGTTQINTKTRISKKAKILFFYNQLDKTNAILNIIINLANKHKKLNKSKVAKNLPENLEKIIKINSSIIASFYCQKLKLNKNDLEFIETLSKTLEDLAQVNDFIWIYKNTISSWLNLARVEIRIAEHLYYKYAAEYFEHLTIQKILNRESTIFFHYAILLENYNFLSFP